MSIPSLCTRAAAIRLPKLLPALTLAAGLLLAAGAPAQTLRWASQGDPQTMDPHSQNESMTNMMNGQVYEKLVARDRALEHRAGPGGELAADLALELALQAAPRGEVPRRQHP